MAACPPPVYMYTGGNRNKSTEGAGLNHAPPHLRIQMLTNKCRLRWQHPNPIRLGERVAPRSSEQLSVNVVLQNRRSGKCKFQSTDRCLDANSTSLLRNHKFLSGIEDMNTADYNFYCPFQLVRLLNKCAGTTKSVLEIILFSYPGCRTSPPSCGVP